MKQGRIRRADRSSAELPYWRPQYLLNKSENCLALGPNQSIQIFCLQVCHSEAVRYNSARYKLIFSTIEAMERSLSFGLWALTNPFRTLQRQRLMTTTGRCRLSIASDATRILCRIGVLDSWGRPSGIDALWNRIANTHFYRMESAVHKLMGGSCPP
jgi:hypothetical protein